jgi:hypothetical protein
MMTHLPIENFAETATVLRDDELYPSRIDAYKVMEALLGIEKRWIRNPVATMWRGSEFFLGQYALTMCNEWKVRHATDSLYDKFVRLIEDAMGAGVMTPSSNADKPWWLGREGFHISHRSNLIRIAPKFYGPIWPAVPDCLPYVYPAGRDERASLKSWSGGT